ncbi:MAG TPA: PPC domain-containing protein, partial [Candidatus Thermoplasmatota archaeon]|nr:PPC domain-containing protein [Candidatus Thermoplasmatota archaeon]
MVLRYSGSGSFTITASELVVPELQPGVPVVGFSTPGSQAFFKLIVPEGATSANFALAGDVSSHTCGFVTCSPDADLYVKRGSLPTLTSRDCRPWSYGNTESCTFHTETYRNVGDPATLGVGSPASIRPFNGPGKYYVMIHGFSGNSDWALTGSFA